ncbi:metallophosphoesterase [Archaeoglobus veneficus]|uniref:Metallophosphoesterase n=1 Tax=Archaeoglobus veneficus (strain DSM 11195 / SNP6) TaxID=693661 RepID=F2KQT0_ARCVS|nr:metallophosphoesterase [Archaeoglobus veneficus]AEA46642.1 metallophosphoesterase [Archaeoglobus veneficus SNP6]
MKIVHISDIHFGEELVRDKVRKAVRQINEMDPDLVIITGDLTCWGTHHEMRDAYEELSNLTPEFVALPGNHDARNIGYEYFKLYFGKTKKVLDFEDFRLITADSTQPDIDEGHIGIEQREWIEGNIKKGKINAIALHHHIVPIPETGRERNVLIDAGEMVELLIRNGVSFVLAGHRHMPYSIRLMRTHIIHAGSLGSFKILGMPDHNYNIIEIEDDKISLTLKFVDYGEVKIGEYSIHTTVPESVDIYRRIAKPKKILFVSRRNACRTQIAEALFNRLSPHNMLAVSSGLEPAERIDDSAKALLAELGLNSDRRPKKLPEGEDFDLVVSFDEDVNADEYWKVKSPENLDECRKAAKEIERRVRDLISRLIAWEYPAKAKPF